MKQSKSWIMVLGATITTVACADEAASPVAPPPGPRVEATVQAPNAGAWFSRYVAVGTSISAGFASEGLHSGTQKSSWPAQLAQMAGTSLSHPWIALPGCRPPFAVPLASFARTSGESVGTPLHLVSCAPNEPGVVLPAGNVSVPGARAWHALFATPENMPPTDANTKVYARILPPNTTQMQAMESRHPAFVSVELGINEVLGARSGVAIPGNSIVEPAEFARYYGDVLARVRGARPEGVLLVGLVKNLSNVPAFRTGSEIYADRGAFLAAFHVDVSTDCSGSRNLITVPTRIPAAVAAGVTARNNGQSPVTFSCSDLGATVADGVLTPAELKVVKDVIQALNNQIKQRAKQFGYAYFELEALYGMPNLKPPFSVVALMTSANPYGAYLSLDGFHPSDVGQAVLANAAAQAIDARYKTSLSTTTIAGVSR